MLDDLSLFNPTGVDVQPHDFEKFERQIEIKWEEERKSVHRKKDFFLEAQLSANDEEESICLQAIYYAIDYAIYYAIYYATVLS